MRACNYNNGASSSTNGKTETFAMRSVVTTVGQPTDDAQVGLIQEREEVKNDAGCGNNATASRSHSPKTRSTPGEQAPDGGGKYGKSSKAVQRGRRLVNELT